MGVAGGGGFAGFGLLPTFYNFLRLQGPSSYGEFNRYCV